MEKQSTKTEKWRRLQAKLYRMVSIGIVDEPVNQAYDVISSAALIINLIATILYTFESIDIKYHDILYAIESITVAFFAIDYILRIITAKYLYPSYEEPKAIWKYLLSGAGIIDFLSVVPFYLPFVFPHGAAFFRMFRLARVLRLFRINAYYDSLNVISEVIVRKKQQLLSSVFIIGVMILASSMCMYSLEHDAQPEVFKNAFSGIWWAVSAVLTVGYGDIYPVTLMGQIVAIIIMCLGVGMVAIPTGIISAGFVEQYQRLKKFGDYSIEENIRFIQVKISRKDSWCGKHIRDLDLPENAVLAVIQRGSETIIPEGKEILQPGDAVIIGSDIIKNSKPVELKQITLGKEHPWAGKRIRDLDISRLTYIVMIKRHGEIIVPKDDMKLYTGDTMILYSQVSVPGEEVTIYNSSESDD